MKQEVAEAILNFEDHEEEDFFVEVDGTDGVIEGQSRWYTRFSSVYEDTRDGTFWKVTWERGSTEMQDSGPENIEVRQVRPVLVERTEYQPVAS